MSRHDSIARSIVSAIRNGRRNRSRSVLSLIFAILSSIFSFFQLNLQKIRPLYFANLRRNHWDVDDDAYIESFRSRDSLKSIGDMGFSGSSFYATSDQKYLVKSVPRHSEHSFFRDDLLTPYVQHMESYPNSMLVRIFDFLGPRGPSIGRALGLAPSHHIVMENIMRGQDQTEEQGRAALWEKWDLKPASYFYPERDIADGRLTSDSTKRQLADEFHDTIALTREQSGRFFASLELDTKLLADHNAVDYSLFLVRITPQGSGSPRQEAAPEEPSGSDATPGKAPLAVPEPQSWRTGIASRDGKHVFRAVLLDFFWAKHKSRPRLMTLLITLWNLVGRHGHMSITTTPDEYRERFLKMCRDIVVVED